MDIITALITLEKINAELERVKDPAWIEARTKEVFGDTGDIENAVRETLRSVWA